MNNNSKKYSLIKSNLSRLDQLKHAQQEWLEAKDILELERKHFGFDAMSLEAF